MTTAPARRDDSTVTMKAIENQYRMFLPPKSYAVIRVWGPGHCAVFVAALDLSNRALSVARGIRFMKYRVEFHLKPVAG